jgi:tRNA (uracil-5-)-methyltransferase
MECKHFGSCGSCTLYDIDYDLQLRDKKARVEGLLASYYSGEIGSFDLPQSHYRARAEFRIWHTGDICNYAMGNLSKDGVALIEMCPKVIEPIERRMWSLLEYINSSLTLSHRLFSVEFLATTTDECLVTMIYHRKLDDEWREVVEPIARELNIKVLGRSRKQKVLLEDEFVVERLEIDGRVVSYKQYESSFTQPNPIANIKMIEWAISKVKSISTDRGDFLESYCGLGNFTIPISDYFDKVLATEVSKKSINSAKENCILNGVDNISFIRLSSEEMTQALNRDREFIRLKDIDLDSYNFSTVLVDPPRAGLDSATIKLISTIEYIIYISCNPQTLSRDLETLSQTHRVVDATLFDQFPYTSHIESGVFLQKVFGE